MFHHTFHQKLKIVLEDAKLAQETQQKLQNFKQNYDDIVSKHSGNIELTHLEEMKIETNPELHPVASKPYPLLLKHHKFVKEEIENL